MTQAVLPHGPGEFLCRPSIFLYKCVTDQENTEEAVSQVQSVSQGVASFLSLSFHNYFCQPPTGGHDSWVVSRFIHKLKVCLFGQDEQCKQVT